MIDAAHRAGLKRGTTSGYRMYLKKIEAILQGRSATV
jgi:hypothetical protein